MKNYVDAEHGGYRMDAAQTTTTLTGEFVKYLNFSIPASATYVFDGYVGVGNSAATGNKWAITFPSDAFMSCTFFGNSAAMNAAAPIFNQSRNMTTSGTLTTTVFAKAADQNSFMTFRGSVTNGATPGYVELKGANVAAGTLTFQRGSYIKWYNMSSTTAF